jgi:hypothetical protein
MDIAKTCLTYLSLDAFACDPNRLSYTDRESLLEQHYLFRYAARNWGYHVEKWDDSISDIALPFLQDSLKAAFTSYFLLDDVGNGIHICAFFGLVEALDSLLERCADINSQTKRWRNTPLFIAVQRDQKLIVERLLEQQGINADLEGFNRWTPLSFAAEYGHEAIVKMLLRWKDIAADSKGINDQTPLSYAAEKGHEAVVKMLLEREDVAADSKDRNGQTPLSFAAQMGYEAIVKMLLEQEDVAADSKDINGQTPLSYAAEQGHGAVVKMLLEREDVAADSKDKILDCKLARSPCYLHSLRRGAALQFCLWTITIYVLCALAVH